MTAQEAIMIIQAIPEKIWNQMARSEEEAIKIAVEALEKQIPKKVQIKRWNPARCPSCGMELSEDCGDGYYRHPTFLEVCPNVECCQRLEEQHKLYAIAFDPEDRGWYDAYSDAIQIVKEKLNE